MYPTHTRNPFLSMAFASLVVLLPLTPAASAEEPAAKTGPNDVSIELAFVTHLDMNMAEQDAFIEHQPGSGQVWRVTKGDHDMSAPLYRTAIEVKHNPFDAATNGPHPIGEPMGMTVGQWLAHTGRGTYTCEDGVGTLQLTFKNLVPNGLYTMWHAFTALPPTTPFSGALELPLGARDGSESLFRADADGRAVFEHVFQPCLQMSDLWTTSMLAIAYHSDDQAWGGSPGKFGLNSHVPLFVKLPLRAGL